MSKLLAVVGPTASGKSETAVKLARIFNAEIINGDSIQVYRQLNIASAKIREEEMNGIVHHLLSYKDVGEEYNVQLFQKDAREKIREIETAGKLPMVVGGTGLYIKALLYDYEFMENDFELKQYEGEKTALLYEKLKALDPVSAEKIHPNNRRRIIRALQMAEGGRLKSRQEEGQKHEMIYDAFVIGLNLNRQLLKERINLRVEKMFDEGLLEEAEYLNRNYQWTAHGLQGIGYKEFEDYFKGSRTLEETKEMIKIHTRQFAKRQYTWWNNQMKLNWYQMDEERSFEKMVEDVRRWLSE